MCHDDLSASPHRHQYRVRSRRVLDASLEKNPEDFYFHQRDRQDIFKLRSNDVMKQSKPSDTPSSTPTHWR